MNQLAFSPKKQKRKGNPRLNVNRTKAPIMRASRVTWIARVPLYTVEKRNQIGYSLTIDYLDCNSSWIFY